MADEDREQHLADREYVVESGYHTARDPDGSTRKCAPGDRFRPTVKQEQDGSLAGKARPVSGADPSHHSGADIGLRALDWDSEAALQEALEAGIDADAFAEAVEPSGSDGGYLVGDVRGYLDSLEAEEPEAGAETAVEEADEVEEPEEDEGGDGGTHTPLGEDFPHADLLEDAGIATLEAVAAAEDLTDVSGIGEARAQEIADALDAAGAGEGG